MVHIDLGIAFEQGKLLTTPEQVPFRLTRDLVDGMGVTACEGVMRRCSEHVLRVLRAHREELLTIAEVAALARPQCPQCRTIGTQTASMPRLTLPRACPAVLHAAPCSHSAP